MTNRLRDASSPYLRQHADNPVDWWPWGEAAFEEARRRDVPVLLSIGYAACHWCHVMAHESFEDHDTAELMNSSFVNIKVDREEHPDVDAVYLSCTTAMTGRAGWPMTCFLTPDGEPFLCGTYFPPVPKHGMPSFTSVLAAVSRAWRERAPELRTAARDLLDRLPDPMAGLAERQPVDAELVRDAVAELAESFDQLAGGFGDAPKFPPSTCLEWLMRHAARIGADDPTARDAMVMVEETAEAMARGGIYDQLGGGFARYSVDSAWCVPHFEKMLYDNALLLRVYAHLWRQTSVPRVRALAHRVAVETGEFLLAELTTPHGAFAASLDADSEGEEGRFYVWSRAELAEVLGAAEGAYAATLFAVTEAGTFEPGRSVLRLPADPADQVRAGAVRRALFEARSTRVRPERDDKVVTAWNGLAIAALADAGALLDRPDFVAAAVRAAEFVIDAHQDDNHRLIRSSLDGAPGPGTGVLEDYADLAEGFLTLYGATADAVWVERAGHLLDVVLDHFADGTGGFFDTADDAPALVRRPRDLADSATPSGLTASAGALLSYAALTGSARHRDAADAALGKLGRFLRVAPRFAGWAGAVLEAALDGPAEVAVVGTADDPAVRALATEVRRSIAPGAVLAIGTSGADVELLAGRVPVGGRPAAYVCRSFVCERPVTDPAELRAQLLRRTA